MLSLEALEQPQNAAARLKGVQKVPWGYIGPAALHSQWEETKRNETKVGPLTARAWAQETSP